MSMPLSESVFKNTIPCQHAKEVSDNFFKCDLTHDFCNFNSNTGECNCWNSADNRYTPIASEEFNNNLRNSFNTSWIKVQHDGFYCYECSHCHSLPPRDRYTNAVDDFTPYCPSCGKPMFGPDDSDLPPTIEPGIYQHFKGRLYEVISVAKHTETNEYFVVYRALYGQHTTYVRPYKMFVDDVEDVEHKYRGPRFYKWENPLT